MTAKPTVVVSATSGTSFVLPPLTVGGKFPSTVWNAVVSGRYSSPVLGARLSRERGEIASQRSPGLTAI
jgi:hypothetical protein